MATASQIREHYDSLAYIYRTFWGDHIHHGLFLEDGDSAKTAQVRLLQHCADLLKLRAGAEVLDVGCGHGGTSSFLAREYDCKITGLTLSSKQSKLALENARAAGVSERVKILVQNADYYDFPARHFDVVWTMESSEHFASKARYFANVAQTLRPQGQLLLAAWTGSMGSSRVREVARAFLCPELWSREEYTGTIRTNGMRVVAAQDLTARVIRTWEICEEHARSASTIVKLLPQAAREFVEGIAIILDAYRSGDLTYTVMAAEK